MIAPGSSLVSRTDFHDVACHNRPRAPTDLTGGLEAHVRRRCFDHLYAELSVEIGKLVPRYALWIAVQESGLDPDRLDTPELTRFFDAHLGDFLADTGLSLDSNRVKQLRRRLVRFDPSVPTPYETMERMFGAFR